MGAAVTRCIGIDLGLTGAVALVDDAGQAQVRDIPTVPDGKSRRIDGRALILLLRQFVPAAGPRPVFVIEDVRPRPNPKRGTSIVTEGSLMRSRGVVEGVADIMGADLRAIQPQAWKRFFGLIGKDKKESVHRARGLFPALAVDLKRITVDQNRAEAVLIAQFGLRKLIA